jgi:pimeloyl-ACP methyl ester carboxylesterase
VTTFVLIHGGSHGAWCWHKLIAALGRLGHEAIAPDLPGSGIDKTPEAGITLHTYVGRVLDLLETRPERVVLVGHSMGGGVITQVAEHRPDKVETLVYLSAVMPLKGMSILGAFRHYADSSAVESADLSGDGRSIVIRRSSMREAFYADCSEEDVALAASLLVPQLLQPITVPLSTTDARFGSVPRIFVECLDDRAISIDMQRRMHGAMPCQKILAIKSSHSPFFSAPAELAQILSSLA